MTINTTSPRSFGLDASEVADLVQLVAKSLDDDKAQDITVIDLVGKSSFADTMVIASAQSTRQVGAMADHLVEKFKAQGHAATVEGKQTCDWVLIDAGDVVVHLFRPEVRAFYNLEKMWGAASPVSATMGTPEHLGLSAVQ